MAPKNDQWCISYKGIVKGSYYSEKEAIEQAEKLAIKESATPDFTVYITKVIAVSYSNCVITAKTEKV